MKITPDTTSEELRSIQPMDYISDCMGKRGHVTEVYRTKGKHCTRYKFKIDAKDGDVYTIKYIYVTR